MRGNKLILLAACFLGSTLADAATWERVFSSTTVVVSVDTDSIAREGSKVKIWGWWVYSSVQQGGFNNGKGHDLYDCAEHTYKSLSSTMYLNEQMVSSFGSSPPQDVVPDTVADAILKYACSKQ